MSRLVTFTGPGGICKTRLVVEVALAVGNAPELDFAFMPLADLQDPAEVALAVAKVLAIELSGPDQFAAGAAWSNPFTGGDQSTTNAHARLTFL